MKILQLLRKLGGSLDDLSSQAKALSNFIGLYVHVAFMTLILSFLMSSVDAADSIIQKVSYYVAISFLIALLAYTSVLTARMVAEFGLEYLSIERKADPRRAMRWFSSSITGLVLLAMVAVGYSAFTAISDYTRLQWNQLQLSEAAR